MLADRLNNLGTETAFAVSLAAAEWGAKGNKIYPFHLGDINLPTPANVVEAMNRAIAAATKQLIEKMIARNPVFLSIVRRPSRAEGYYVACVALGG